MIITDTPLENVAKPDPMPWFSLNFRQNLDLDLIYPASQSFLWEIQWSILGTWSHFDG